MYLDFRKSQISYCGITVSTSRFYIGTQLLSVYKYSIKSFESLAPINNWGEFKACPTVGGYKNESILGFLTTKSVCKVWLVVLH
jgi:hypothetical protein